MKKPSITRSSLCTFVLCTSLSLPYRLSYPSKYLNLFRLSLYRYHGWEWVRVGLRGSVQTTLQKRLEALGTWPQFGCSTKVSSTVSRMVWGPVYLWEGPWIVWHAVNRLWVELRRGLIVVKLPSSQQKWRLGRYSFCLGVHTIRELFTGTVFTYFRLYLLLSSFQLSCFRNSIPYSSFTYTSSSPFRWNWKFIIERKLPWCTCFSGLSLSLVLSRCLFSELTLRERIDSFTLTWKQEILGVDREVDQLQVGKSILIINLPLLSRTSVEQISWKKSRYFSLNYKPRFLDL